MKSHFIRLQRGINMLCMLAGMIMLPGCAEATQPELRKDQLFGFDLRAGQSIQYHSPSASLEISGPAHVEWAWEDGKLTISSEAGSARIRPLEQFPHEEMSTEMIRRAQAHFTSVPRITELLGSNSNPTLKEWAAAYVTWLEEISAAEATLKLAYSEQAAFDYATLAESLALQYAAHPLVVPGAVRIAAPERESSGRDLWVVYKGVPPREDGSADEWLVPLRTGYRMPEAPSSWFSHSEALGLHHAIYIAAQSGRPFSIDLSRGERLIAGRR